MAFTQSELNYLASQQLGRLATVQPDGTLQANPVGFSYNPGLDTIDITGYALAGSRKYRNVADNGRVAFVVDDVVSIQPLRVRCVEIRGRGEAAQADEAGLPSTAAGIDGALIRIHPERIISFGIDSPAP